MFMQFEDQAAIVVCHRDGAMVEEICDHLTADGYETLRASSGEEALRFCRYNQPDLMILDERLPDRDGIEVLRAIRQADGIVARYDPDLPIIVVADRDDDGRIRAFDEGADDFLAQGISYSEFKARIAAVLRRSMRRGDSAVRVGELVIDPARWMVLVGEREVHLTKMEFRLLQKLASDPTRVFSKDELLSAVWGGKRLPGKTRTVDSHLSRLRRKLDPDHSNYVFNCWGIGYRLVDA
jgi:DNA-binding response OmpR family regulator